MKSRPSFGPIVLNLSPRLREICVQQAHRRHMALDDFCTELIEVALVSLGQMGSKTIEERAMERSAPAGDELD